MKFKVGDKVMLKSVPYGDWGSSKVNAIKYYEEHKGEKKIIESILENKYAYFKSELYFVSLKYLKHAVNPKSIKYTLDCRGRNCDLDCPKKIFIHSAKRCYFTGTKKQIEAHIKRYWTQPKIKAVK